MTDLINHPYRTLIMLRKIFTKMFSRNQERLDKLKTFTESEVTTLPDHSGCFSIGIQLPDDHWLFDKNIVVVSPFVENPPVVWRKKLRLAIMVGIKQATDNGNIIDYDPDAMVQCIENNIIVGDISEAQINQLMEVAMETDQLGGSPKFSHDCPVCDSAR